MNIRRFRGIEAPGVLGTNETIGSRGTMTVVMDGICIEPVVQIVEDVTIGRNGCDGFVKICDVRVPALLDVCVDGLAEAPAFNMISGGNYNMQGNEGVTDRIL